MSGLGKALMAEFVGTYIRTMVAAGAGVVDAATNGQVPWPARATATGLSDMALIYTLGEISGAHFNPVVSVAFASRGVFPWKHVPAFSLAQLLGAVTAALTLRGVFGAACLHGGLSQSKFGDLAGFVVETFLTFTLLMVILGSANHHKVVGPNAAIGVGGTVILNGLWAWPVTGASMNPARTLGPALVAGSLQSVWLYVAGPLLGAWLAVGLTYLLHGPANAEEEKTARGEDHEDQQKVSDQPRVHSL